MYVSCCNLCFTSRVKNIESKFGNVTPRETILPPIMTVKGDEGYVALSPSALRSRLLLSTTDEVREAFSTTYSVR